LAAAAPFLVLFVEAGGCYLFTTNLLLFLLGVAMKGFLAVGQTEAEP
jgi:hypothetical protein